LTEDNTISELFSRIHIERYVPRDSAPDEKQCRDEVRVLG
jgi:hypothetical protein